MPKHRTRVGLHARNDVRFPDPDFDLVRRARIETMKMMSHTDVGVFDRLRRENPDLEFIVRLYDDRLRFDSRPSPADFVAKMVPIIQRLRPYATKYEIHNEPNHVDGIEGWGPTDQHARSFLSWYMQVLPALKQACPWASFGFPGLALNYPHRDMEWLDICRDAIVASDWLGCHCYWQYGNMMHGEWGLRFKLYNKKYPGKKIEITEFGDSTPNRPRHEIAEQFIRYYQELNKYPYLGSASAFIASSPDPAWSIFVWMKEGGEMLPVVQAVANMDRVAVEVAPPPKPAPTPKPAPPPPELTERTFSETGKTVKGSFLQFFNRYGLDICGYPITDQIEEHGLPAQYFQRVALEEFQPGQVRLKLVGTEAWASRPKITELEARIEEFRRRPPSGAGPAQPAIKDVVEQLPTHPTERYPSRPLTDVQQVVIHHTATSPTITVERVAQYQVRNLNKPGAAYHFFITADGVIYQTNKLETVSDHAYRLNQESVGVCFAGNFTDAIPPAAQMEAGAQLCAWLLGALRLPTSKIVGLGEFVNTQSPGRQWLKGERWKEKLLAQVEAALEVEGEDQSALITSLREQIEALQEEIDKLKKQPIPPVPKPKPEPAPGPVKVARPPIQDMVDKLHTHKTKGYNSRPLTDIKTLVIHHSAVAASVGPQRIAQYHVNNLDWPGIGYHFLVAEDGIIYQGNKLTTVSYHAAKVNPRGVGVCFLGNFTKVVPPPAQLQAGARLAAWLLQELDLDLETVKGHQEFMGTACPGNQWLKGKQWKQMLRQEIVRVQEEVTVPGPLPTPPPEAKPLYHYMLFWHHGDQWAQKDWLNSQDYIGAFQPTVGFSAKEAAQAECVTIVGGPLGVSQEVEDWLKANGCKVDRLAGKDEGATKQMMTNLIKKGKRFRSFDE
jgi:N-acetyl-anhydromuramyl-L-alanine amidase AmpD